MAQKTAMGVATATATATATEVAMEQQRTGSPSLSVIYLKNRGISWSTENCFYLDRWKRYPPPTYVASVSSLYSTRLKTSCHTSIKRWAGWFWAVSSRLKLSILFTRCKFETMYPHPVFPRFGFLIPVSSIRGGGGTQEISSSFAYRIEINAVDLGTTLGKCCSMSAAWFSVVLLVTEKLVLSIRMVLPFLCVLQANALTSLPVKNKTKKSFFSPQRYQNYHEQKMWTVADIQYHIPGCSGLYC